MIPMELKVDKKGLLYLDMAIDKSDKVFLNPNKNNCFYRIPSTTEYIVKYNNRNVIYDDCVQIERMLEEFNKRRGKLHNIDLPIGYYLEDELIKGLIVYCYDNAISLRDFCNIKDLSALTKYYCHEDHLLKNLIRLYLEIISIVEEMLDSKMYYLDIHSGNFVLFNNQLKLIDFEPNQIAFNKDNNVYYERIVFAVSMLINYINHQVGFDYTMDECYQLNVLKEKVKKLEGNLK